MQITNTLVVQEIAAKKTAIQKTLQNQAQTDIAAIANAEPSAKVSLSGRAIMISRLFGNEEPPIEYGTDHALDYSGKGWMAFLQHEDRNLIADIYEYAQRKGIAFEHVDILARQLASYRSSDSGRALSEFNSLDLEGHIQISHFKEEAAKTVDRIKNSAALQTTRFDQNYLKTWALNEKRLAGNNTDFEFLNHMVHRFSSEGSDDMDIPERFLSYIFIKREEMYIETTDKIDPTWQEDQDRIAKEAAMPEALKNKDSDAVRKDLRKLKAAQKETMIQTFLDSIAITQKVKDQNTENARLQREASGANKKEQAPKLADLLQGLFSPKS